MHLNKLALIASILVSSLAHSQTQKIEAVDIQNKMYSLNKITSEQANYGIFHLTVPTNSALTFVSVGGDTFVTGRGISGHSAIDRNGNSIIFNMPSTPGQYSLVAVTKCGVSISAVVDVFDGKQPRGHGEVINKVAFDAPENCEK